MATDLKPYSVTIVAFDPTEGPESGDQYVLPVDSPDEDHAIASTLANAASFTRKYRLGKVLSVAFMCKSISPRE